MNMKRTLIALIAIGILSVMAYAADKTIFNDNEVWFGSQGLVKINKVTGIVTAESFGGTGTTFTGASNETITNATDAQVAITADDDAVELLDVKLISSNTSTSAGDNIIVSIWAEDDASASTEYANLQFVFDDETT